MALCLPPGSPGPMGGMATPIARMENPAMSPGRTPHTAAPAQWLPALAITLLRQATHTPAGPQSTSRVAEVVVAAATSAAAVVVAAVVMSAAAVVVVAAVAITKQNPISI